MVKDNEDDDSVDIDEKIRRLEEELEEDDEEEEDSCSSDDSSMSKSEEDLATINGSGGRSDGRGVLSLSTVKDERIESLPEQCLPAPRMSSSTVKTRKEKKRTDAGRHQQVFDGSDNKKKRRVKDDDGNGKECISGNSSDGLEMAVREVLNGYVARSSEKLPFYCRLCSKQYGNMHEFNEHKMTTFHQTAVRLERKASLCKLCNKQFNSPVQLKEHLSSRPHKERLHHMQQKQRLDRKRRQPKHKI